jgi:signal transduction histidine kinase
MPDGGVLHFFAEADASQVIIQVSDTGEGIPTDALEHIFEPFFTTKEVGRGTGLGLALAFEVVQQHGGSIRCNSLVGKGTTFILSLSAA